MKRPLYWHKERQKNAAEYHSRKRERAEQDLAEALAEEAEVTFYSQQIEEAERRGMDAFDRERFMKKRGRARR